MKQTLLYPLILLLLFAGCKKEELPVTAHDPGSVITTTVNMDASYKWQIYFDLKTNSVVGQNHKIMWDLGFEANGNHIILNGAKAMYAFNTGLTNFADVTDTNGLSLYKTWDEPSGNFDSTAIGNWEGTNNVYIIDRGYSDMGIHQGFRKIVFQAVDPLKYTIHFANLDGSNDTIMEIYKDSTYNFQHVSFNGTGSVVLVEPPKAAWDLCFTQYLHIFYDPLQPYLVTGCLLNRYQTWALLETTESFSNINYIYASGLTLSDNINSIGYSWKEFISGVYTVNPAMNYIIRDREGLMYKLHFIDFYNTSGVKGNPTWEFQQL